MKLDKVKWGFIGCGEVTEKKSGPAFNMIEGSEVVAVMSRDEEKVKSYAMRHHIPRWYTDAQELIGDEDVNAIYIATPPSSHATFAIMAMKAGKPVYIEKPMAASYEDCARINRISRETGVPCFVAYYRRYLPYFQKVRQLVEEGEIGNVINVIWIIIPRICRGVYNRTLPEEGISTTLLLISSTSYRTCSDVFWRLKVIRATEADFTKRRIPSVPASSSSPDCRVPGRGVSLHTNRRKKTVLRLSAIRECSVSRYLRTSLSDFIPNGGAKRFFRRILPTYSFRLFRRS